MPRFTLKTGIIPLVYVSTIFIQTCEASKVAVCTTATGRYLSFARDLIESMRPRFMVGHDVTYFVFTDQPMDPEPDIRVVPWRRFGWPGDTMKRTSAYLTCEKELSTYDWVLATDADMLVVGPITEDFFADTVAVRHGGFSPGNGSWETDPRSTAYVEPSHRQLYFCGGVYGGSGPGFLRICRFCETNQNIDEANGITAIWHDESHLNHFFEVNPPSKIASVDYCWSDNLPSATAKILARTKDHSFYRSP